MMLNLWEWVNMVVLLTTAACAALYLGDKHHTLRNLRAVGIALIAGCAFGRGLAFFWPGDHDGLVPWLRFGLDVGMCSFFVAVARGQVAQLFEEPPMRAWHKQVLEACEVAKHPEDWELIRRMACAALRRDGVEQRDAERKPVEAHEEQASQSAAN